MDDDALGVLTRWRILVGAVLLLGVVTSLGAVVGLVGAREDMHFDWELAAIFGTALGTTLLAVATGALAYSTSGDVRATWRLARLTRDDQLAREKPVVVLTDYGWADDPQEESTGCITIGLMNIGLGPALDIVVEARYPEVPDHGPLADPPPKEPPGPGLVRVLLPGERTRFGLPVVFSGPRPDWPQYAFVEIRATYTGRGRNRRYNLDGDEVPDSERFVWTDPNTRGFIMASVPQEDT